MPYLVVPEKKDSELDPMSTPKRNWVVTWTVLPYFLAANTDLVRHVDKRLRERFAGETIFSGDPGIQREMSELVIEAILEKTPMVGLREVLQAILELKVAEKLEMVPDLTPLPPKEPPKLEVVGLDESLEEAVK